MVKGFDFIKALAMILAMTAVIVTGAWAQEDASVYVITPSTNSRFTATKNGSSISSLTNQYIQNLINAIRTDAGGGNVTIQFENGQSTLDIDDEDITFFGGWGKITLLGKLISDVGISGTNLTADTLGVIIISDDVSVDSRADIENKSDGSGPIYKAIVHKSTGILNIIDGNITAGYGNTINGRTVSNYSSGTINISGGTITAEGSSGVAVYNYSSGTINISGGTITETATSGTNMRTVYNNSGGTVKISGGSILALDYAVYNNGGGTINISGGDISATGSSNISVVNNNSGGTINISGGDISATGSSNISVVNNNSINNGTINITGGTINSPLNSSAYAVYTNSANNSLVLGGTINITGTIRIASNSTSAGLSVITEGENKFEPDDKVYTLVLSSYSNGNVAVNNGAAFHRNFEFYNQASNSAAINGNNLVAATLANVKTVKFAPNNDENVALEIPVISGGTIDAGLKPFVSFAKIGYINDGWIDSDSEEKFVFGGEENTEEEILPTKVENDITLALGYRAANVDITADALANGTYNAAYSATVSASVEENVGGNISYEVANGALPQGLTLTESGTISGTPAESGSFTFEIKATNEASGKVSDEKEFTISVNKAGIDISKIKFDLSPKTYNGASQGVGVSAESGINGLGEITVKYNGSLIAPVNAGTYAVTASIAEGQNYNATTADINIGNYVISKAAQTAPIISDDDIDITQTGVTFPSVAGAEYSYEGQTWQDSRIFSGLTDDTEYKFLLRLKETPNHSASSIVEITLRTLPLDNPVPIIGNKAENKKGGGILLDSVIVSQSAKITVNTPEPSQISVIVFDNLGNALFEASGRNGIFVWNLTNKAGKNVANSTYLIISESVGASGKAYRYQAKVGVKR